METVDDGIEGIENIYKKLIKLRAAVNYLEKKNTCIGGKIRYNYVSSTQVLFSVRKKMDELGIMIIPEILEQNVEMKPGKNQYLTILKMQMNIVNAEKPSDFIKICWAGQGIDSMEKGIGKALTYAEKYFFMKLLNIPTDADDPDHSRNSNMFDQKNRIIEIKNKIKAESPDLVKAKKTSIDLFGLKIEKANLFQLEKILEVLKTKFRNK